MSAVISIMLLYTLLLLSCQNSDYNSELEYLKDYTILHDTGQDDSLMLSDNFISNVITADEINGPWKSMVREVTLVNKEGTDTVSIRILSRGPRFQTGSRFYQAKDSLLVINPAYVRIYKPKHLDIINHAAAKQLESFFQWYLFHIYPNLGNSIDHVEVIKSPEGVWGLDIEKHIEHLRESNFFHEEFLIKETAKLSKCSEAMGKKDFDYENEGNWLIPECDFMWYYNWVGGQGESLNGFSVVKLMEDSTHITGSIEILTIDGVFSISTVELKLVDGKYKITDIRLN